MAKPSCATPPSSHIYTVTLHLRSDRPYTITELQDPVKWWVFVKDRQVKVETVIVKAQTKGGTRA